MSPATVLVYGIGVFFLSFARWYVFLGRKLGQKYISNADTWVFLSDARKIRRGNFKLSSRYREDKVKPVNNVAFALRNHYPPLFFYFLAIIPDKYTDYVVRYSVPLVDAFVASTLFSSIVFITSSLELGILGVIIYLSSPMIFQSNFSACVRPLSVFLVSIVYLLSISLSIQNFLGLSILISIILLLHKFAAQVVFFTAAAFLFIGRPDYLLSVVVGFLIAMLVSRGYYLKVLRAHIDHLRTEYLKQWARRSAKNPLRRTAALVVYCPWILFFVISIFVSGWSLFSALLVCTSTWIITLTIFSVITNFSILRNIGEGWRYLGYLVFPMSFFVVYVVGYSPILQWVYAVCAFSGLIIEYYYTSRLYKQQQKYLIDREDTRILKRISSLKGNEIIAYPDEFTRAAAYFSEKDSAVELQFADIIVFNKKLVEESLPKTFEEKGYLSRFEEKDWIVYSR